MYDTNHQTAHQDGVLVSDRNVRGAHPSHTTGFGREHLRPVFHNHGGRVRPNRRDQYHRRRHRRFSRATCADDFT